MAVRCQFLGRAPCLRSSVHFPSGVGGQLRDRNERGCLAAAGGAFDDEVAVVAACGADRIFLFAAEAASLGVKSFQVCIDALFGNRFGGLDEQAEGGLRDLPFGLEVMARCEDAGAREIGADVRAGAPPVELENLGAVENGGMRVPRYVRAT